MTDDDVTAFRVRKGRLLETETLVPIQSHPIVRRPADLPDMRMWLLDQWRDGENFAMLAELIGGPLQVNSEYAPLERVFDQRALATARLYYVTADMAHLIQAAAKTLPETTLTPELVPWPAGLVYYEDSLVGKDCQVQFSDGAINVRMVLWGEAILPPHGDSHIGIASYAETDDGFISPSGRTDWIFGQDTDAPTDDSLYELSEAEYRIASMAEDRRWLATFWLLISQSGDRSVADETEVRTPRPVARRSERRKLTSNVRVIDVHQPKHSEPTGTGRKMEYSHRFMVGADDGGFWRQQAYGPRHSLRRPQFIPAYIKGPKDKPLIIKDTVRVLKEKT